MLHGQVDQLKSIVLINWKQSVLYHEGDNRILKIPESSIEIHLHQLGYINRFDVRVPHKLSVFPHAILYWNVRKTFRL